MAEAPVASLDWRRLRRTAWFPAALLGFAAVAIGVDLAGGFRDAAPDRSPSACLRDAGLTGINQPSALLWTGEHARPFFGVDVNLLPSVSAAREAVAQADLVSGQAVGRYAVLGPARASGGEAVVEQVALCLKG